MKKRRIVGGEMKRKRICFIAKFVKGIHPYTGGMETHIDDLIKGLKKNKNYELSIITSKSPSGKKFEEIENVKIYYVNKTIGRIPWSRYKFFKSVARKLKEIDYESKFDLIHIQSDFGVGYFQYIKKKLPIVSTIHGTATNEFKGSIKAKLYLLPIWILTFPFYFRTEKNMIKNSDVIISVSEIVRKDLIIQQNIKTEKTKTIFNGIDLEYFKPLKNKEIENLRKEFSEKGDFLLISVGNIIKQKGYHLIIEAFPKIIEKNPKVKLLIVGGGDYLKNLKNIAKKLNLEKNVFFTGKIKRENLRNYYCASDAFVFPTLRGEGLPYVLIEAMACGLIPITCLNGGIGDIVNKKNGVIINLNKKENLKDKIIGIITNKEKQKDLRKQGQKDITEKFDLKKMVKENIKIYEEILRK